MNWIISRGALVGFLAGGVAACSTTPAYPVTPGQEPAAPIRPRYAVEAQAKTRASAQPSVVASQDAAPVVTQPSASPAPVESAPLPPITSPPPSSPAADAPPPTPQAPSSPPPMRHLPTRYAAAGHVVSPHGMYRDYVVRRHDHLDAIARDLDASPEAIVKANHIRTPDHLTPGQHLRIPVEKAYVAQAGDTLALVAERFSVSAGELADINDLPERGRLRSGDQIALPASFHDRGPVELTPSRLAAAASPYARGRVYGAYESTPGGGALTPIRPSGGGSSSYLPSTSTETAAPALSDTQIAALAHSRFVWPVHGEIINGFGVKGLGVRNDGVDVRSPMGSVVRAAAPGDVVYAGNQIPGYGNLVLIQHADGWVTAYAHLARMSVQMRQHVDQGQEIGEVGTSGGVAEPQLHFEVRYKASAGETARPVDPLLVLPAQTGAG